MKSTILTLCFLVSLFTARSQDTLNLHGIENSKLLPVLWQQTSAEYQALCYQAFNFAAYRLDDMKLKRRKRYAIITDVDETVLDNSYYEARRILQNAEFELSSWKQWTGESKATPVPGALEFLQRARERGIEIFYISNRDTSEVASTLSNLKNLGFPDADRDHVLFLENTSAKEPRRQKVMQSYNVVMMLGDNLNDFAVGFEKKNIADRKLEAQKFKDEWGKKFIVLPNAIYGEWENALYDYSRRHSPTEKEIALRKKLTTNP